MPIRLALVLASAAILQGSTLKWVPKEGDVARYRTEFSTADKQLTLSFLNEHKVIRVDPDGSFLVQVSPKEAKISMGGQEATGGGVTTLTTYLPNGEIKEIRGDTADVTGYRMANLTIFHAPTKAVAAGDAWTSEGKADPKTGAVGWKADYKVVGEETIQGFPSLKLEVAARETEGTDAGKTAGTMWVGKDGMIVRSELTWTNVAVPGSPTPVSGKYTLSRVP